MSDQSWPTIPALIDDAGARFPDTVGISHEGVALSFPDLVARIKQSAKALIGSGIEAGDRIAVWAPNTIEWVICALGVHYAGATLVTINTRFKATEAEFVLSSAKARMLFTVSNFLDADYVAMLEGSEVAAKLDDIVVLRGGDSGTSISFDSFLARADSISDERLAERSAAVSSDDICHILFTSGTTGSPKGVLLDHGQVCAVYETLGQIMGYEHGDKQLVVLPFFHSFGLHVGILTAFMYGMTILPQLVFDTDDVMQRISDEKVTLFPGPPSIFQSMMMSPNRENYDLSSLRVITIGAAGFAPTLVPDILERLGVEYITTGYGLTEASGTVAITKLGEANDVITETDGSPLPGVSIRIINDEGDALPNNEAGEVLVKGFNVMRGYLDDEAATASTIDADGWLHTGDVGYMRDDGNLVITDRLKDMYLVGGFNAYPAEIEAMLAEHPAIAQVAVIGVPDDRLDEVGMAFVIAEPGSSPSESEIIEWAREHMANYKVPRFVRLVSELPLNATGKVLKGVLREELQG